jgi:hypothetical protein
MRKMSDSMKRDNDERKCVEWAEYWDEIIIIRYKVEIDIVGGSGWKKKMKAKWKINE